MSVGRKSFPGNRIIDYILSSVLILGFRRMLFLRLSGFWARDTSSFYLVAGEMVL